MMKRFLLSVVLLGAMSATADAGRILRPRTWAVFQRRPVAAIVRLAPVRRVIRAIRSPECAGGTCFRGPLRRRLLFR